MTPSAAKQPPRHRARFGYQLRKGETAANAAKRLGDHGDAVAVEGEVVTVIAELGGEPSALWDGEGTAPGWLGRFASARIERLQSGAVQTLRVQTDEETFEVIGRGGRLFVLDVDGFGGVDAIEGGDLKAAFERAYTAYRAVLAAERR